MGDILRDFMSRDVEMAGWYGGYCVKCCTHRTGLNWNLLDWFL
jgi:hypothetical protein